MSSIAALPLRFLPQAKTGGYEENASAESVRLLPDLPAARGTQVAISTTRDKCVRHSLRSYRTIGLSADPR